MTTVEDEILAGWGMVQRYWDERSGRCGNCSHPLQSGEVTLVFGAVHLPDEDAPAIEQQEIRCLECAWLRLEKGDSPVGAAVFVQQEHRREDFDALSPDIQGALRSGFLLLADFTRLAASAKAEDPTVVGG